MADASGTPTPNFSFPTFNTANDAPSGLGENTIIADVDTKLAANTTNLGAIARAIISKAGTVIGKRRQINFIEGTGIQLTIADDSGNEKVDVTVTNNPTWQNYAPSWTASGTAPAIGNGSLSGRFMQVGKLVIASLFWQAGSTTTFGTGTYRFSLPANAAASVGTIIGDMQGFQSPNSSFAQARVQAAGAMEFNYPLTWPTGTFTTVAQTAPFTWANGNSMQALVVYEAA